MRGKYRHKTELLQKSTTIHTPREVRGLTSKANNVHRPQVSTMPQGGTEKWKDEMGKGLGGGR